MSAVKLSAVRSIAGAVLAALLVAAGVLVAQDLGSWPIRSVRVAGDFRHLQRQSLEAAIAPHLRAGFFRIDLREVRRTALALPWVRQLSVRRVWPDSLHVAVIEREAVARWVGDGILDSDGTLFVPDRLPVLLGLPKLAGPQGSHTQVLARYRALQQTLGGVLPSVTELELTARGGWNARLANGTRLVLGREPDTETLEAFASVFGTALAARLDEARVVDMRYANGFAVRWRAAGSAVGEQGS